MVTLELTDRTRRKIERDVRLAREAMATFAEGLDAACGIGSEEVAEHLVLGELGLTMRNPGQGGLAGAVMGWMIDPAEPLGAIGVRGNHPAAVYAGIQEEGGTIYPKTARALAVPVSEEAKLLSTPREQGDLVLIPRPGRAPILARVLGDRVEVHWVLKASVTIEATHWLSRGVEMARGEMVGAFQDVVDGYAEKW